MHGLEDCQLTFTDVRLPAEEPSWGRRTQAFKMAMRNFNFSRLMMSSMALGMVRAAFEDAVAYARTRKQFGQPIFELPGDPVHARRHVDRHRRRLAC